MTEMAERNDLAKTLYVTDKNQSPNAAENWALEPRERKYPYYVLADAVLSRDYVLSDHIEYAAQHPLAGTDITDDDGNLWLDRAALEEWYASYPSARLLQRHVTAWEPLSD